MAPRRPPPPAAPYPLRPAPLVADERAERPVTVAWVGWLPLAYLCGVATGFAVGLLVALLAL